jgi:putative transcriptional regulator
LSSGGVDGASYDRRCRRSVGKDFRRASPAIYFLLFDFAMPMRPGTLLISQPFLGDPNFERSVVLLCRDEPEDGSFGLVLNRLTNLLLGDVLELPVHLAGAADELPIYLGGPVEPNTLHYVHRRADLPGAQDLGQDVYWGGDFDVLLGLLASGTVAAAEIRLFAGYSGWSAGQLAGEMQAQSWIRHPASAGKVFTLASDAFWRDILREKGGRFKVLANYPVDPRLN